MAIDWQLSLNKFGQVLGTGKEEEAKWRYQLKLQISVEPGYTYVVVSVHG